MTWIVLEHHTTTWWLERESSSMSFDCPRMTDVLIPNHGCRPSLTAVLWDVTDAEIDKVAQSTVSQLRMDSEHIPDTTSALSEISDHALSNAQALAKARDCCRLKYLTGAAPVTYGIPIYIR